MRTVAVLAVLLTACATPPRPATCGAGWAPLSTTTATIRDSVQGIDRSPDGPLAATIEHVRIAGVDANLATMLSRSLATRPGTTLADAPLGADIRRLWALGVVDNVHVEVAGGDVTFVIMPHAMIQGVVAKGGDTLAQQRFQRLVATPFEAPRIRRMTTALEQSYLREGRLDARVEARQRAVAGGIEVCVATNPGPRVTIDKLEFVGRKQVSEAKLRAVIHGEQANINRVGGTFDADALELDNLYLAAEYWEHGHAEVKIGAARVQRRGRHLAVTIPIDEGPVYRLGSVTVVAPIALAVDVRPGEVFSRNRIAAARDKLTEAFGSPHAYVLPLTKIDQAHATIDLTFEVTWRWPWDALRFWLSRSR